MIAGRIISLVAALLSFLFFSGTVYAADWTWYINSTELVTGDPAHLDVTLGVRADSEADTGRLGSYALRGTISSSLFDFGAGTPAQNPVIKENFLTDYSVTLTNPDGASNWQYNCAYDGVEGAGALVTQAGIQVVSIRFFVSDLSGSSNITFNTIQQTFLDDAMTAARVSYDAGGGNVPLPITLASFSAKANPDGGGVRVEWTTLSEINNYGFYVQRRAQSDSSFTELANSFVPGHGTTLQPQDYAFIDRSITRDGLYYYRLRQVDLDGTQHFGPSSGTNVTAGLTSVEEAAPLQFRLFQNYPNPFNPSTEFKFCVETTGHATLRLYSTIGEEVATLFDGVAVAGQYYRTKMDGSHLASGVYFYRFQSGSKCELKKMMLLK